MRTRMLRRFNAEDEAAFSAESVGNALLNVGA